MLKWPSLDMTKKNVHISSQPVEKWTRWGEMSAWSNKDDRVDLKDWKTSDCEQQLWLWTFTFLWLLLKLDGQIPRTWQVQWISRIFITCEFTCSVESRIIPIKYLFIWPTTTTMINMVWISGNDFIYYSS